MSVTMRGHSPIDTRTGGKHKDMLQEGAEQGSVGRGKEAGGERARHEMQTGGREERTFGELVRKHISLRQIVKACKQGKRESNNEKSKSEKSKSEKSTRTTRPPYYAYAPAGRAALCVPHMTTPELSFSDGRKMALASAALSVHLVLLGPARPQ